MSATEEYITEKYRRLIDAFRRKHFVWYLNENHIEQIRTLFETELRMESDTFDKFYAQKVAFEAVRVQIEKSYMSNRLIPISSTALISFLNGVYIGFMVGVIAMHWPQ